MRVVVSLLLVITLIFGFTVWSSNPAISVDRAEVDAACSASKDALRVVEEGATRLQETTAAWTLVNAELEGRSLAALELRSEAEDRSDAVSELRSLVNERAVLMYVNGTSAQSASLFGSESITDFFSGRRWLSDAAGQDMSVADDLEQQVGELLELNDELRAENDKLSELNKEVERVTTEANQALLAAQSAYYDLDGECARLLAEYQAEQRRLEAERLANVANGAGGLPAEATPGFICPVAQPLAFINDWGFPRSGGRTHKGTDVFTPYGQEQFAVANGTVELLSGGLGGTGIWLNSDYGVRYYYAHMSGFAPGLTDGQTVSIGDVVGYTGNSGNARTTPSHLHFGIRPSTGGWVNPYPTLARNC